MGNGEWGMGNGEWGMGRNDTPVYRSPFTHSLFFARNAFNTTSKELADIPIAAIHGVT